MTTGLTPTLNSLKALVVAGTNKGHFFDLRSGSLRSLWSDLTLTPAGGARLQRNGGACAVPGTDYFRSAATGLSGTEASFGVIFKLTGYPSSSAYPIRDDDTGLSDWAVLISNSTFRPTLAVGFSGGTKQTAAIAGTEVINGVVSSVSGSFRNNNADGVRCYKDGMAIAHANVATTGETLLFPDNGLMLGRAVAANGFIGIIIAAWEINKYLTAAEHAALYDEIVNQLTYETQDCLWPVSTTVYWRGAFGALARETAMAAGRSIGDINELVVASGTHKMSTEKLDGILTKCIVCVTSGTINLPAYNLGANYVFEKYTASTGLWTTVTQASRSVALLVGDKILWANQTGNRHIKRIY